MVFFTNLFEKLAILVSIEPRNMFKMINIMVLNILGLKITFWDNKNRKNYRFRLKTNK